MKIRLEAKKLFQLAEIGANMTSTGNVSSLAAGLYDDHTKPHFDVTHTQLTFFLACSFAAILWVLRIPRARSRAVALQVKQVQVVKDGSLFNLSKNSLVEEPPNDIKHDVKSAGPNADVEAGDVKRPSRASSAVGPPTPTLDEALKDATVFGAIMFYFFLCDYVKVFAEEPRIYNRDVFLFLLCLLFLVAAAFTLTPTQDKILNRDQTEEWKGWMQVMFVWYHYFAAKEWYNWIRVYIASYVWMTGFGNFSFFWVRGDYSLWRVLKMLFRMNFLVIAVTMVTANEYMLYYICAMHTYWFLTVYVFMGVLRSWNTHRWKMAAKFAAYLVCNALIFEIPGMCSMLFRPLWFMFQFHDNVHDIMHEWEFRAGLDHWACFLGMLCAYNYPHFEAFNKYLDRPSEIKHKAKIKVACRLVMLAVALIAGVTWYTTAMTLNKFAYNNSHCYTSLVPILTYIVVRNSFPILRRYTLALFGTLGKITLETYLSQLHVYLQSNAKGLIGYIHGYPLLNFALATIIYLGISHALFNLTLSFSAFFIRKDWHKGAKMAALAGGVFAVSAAVSFVIKIYV